MNIENTKENNKQPKAGLHCVTDRSSSELFFSLVDYRNNYFTSRDSKKIREFYKGFKNRDQLIQWMEERPKGVPIIHEVEGDKKIIVVIPTAELDGKYAKECRESIFKGLHIIFVESSGKNDFYFNFSHFVNAGIRKAMEYDPKWIIYSGDDVIKIDSPEVLIAKLNPIDNKKIMSVFTKQGFYHSIPTGLITQRKIIGYIITSIYAVIKGTIGIQIKNHRIWEKYNIKWSLGAKNGLFSKLAYKEFKPFILTATFGIFSSEYCKINAGNVLDETFINGCEDWDVSIKLNKLPYEIIDYKISELAGSTLGNLKDYNRNTRNILNMAYLNKKIVEIKDYI